MDILSLIQWRSETLNGERDPGKIISALSTKGLEGVPLPPASEGALVKFRKKDTKARLKVIAEAFAATGGQEQPEPSETPQNQARPEAATNYGSPVVGQGAAIERVRFHGQSLEGLWLDGEPYVTMKSICEPFGRRPSEQLDRCQTYHVKVIKTRIGNTHAWVIPADDVPWFITTLAHDGMTPAVLRTHVLWTKEVRQVLADYFHRGVAHNPRVEAASQLNVQELEQRLVAAVTDALRPFISQTVGSAMQTHFQPLIETVNRLVARPADPPAPSPVQDSRNVRTTTTVDGKQVAKTAPRGKWHTIQQVHQNLSKFLAHSGVPTETAILTHIRVTGMFGELWQKYDTKRGDVWEEDTIKELRLHWKPSTDAGREVDFDISGKDIDDMLAGAGSV